TIPDFPHDLLDLILHLVLSHHGEYEYGSPRLPVTVEAMADDYIDNLDAFFADVDATDRKVRKALAPVSGQTFFVFHPSFGYFAEAYGLKVLTTRMFTHTGPRRGDVFAESSFAKQIAMIEAKQIEPPLKVGNLESVRTIADVRDAVRAYHMLLTVNPQVGAVYNIGGTHTCTIGQVLDTLFEVAGQRYEVEVDPARLRPIDADHQVPDCSKFMDHTGWKPEIPFEQTMVDLLEYWREKVKRTRPLQR
ncbi:hypothetical protein LCGC14_3070140, partial [marine sediment metagenome]